VGPAHRGSLSAILARCLRKHSFIIYAYAIMSNHVHLVLCARGEARLDRFMHDVNWYSAMAFNRMLGRTGHFWEARYHATAIRAGDDRHALATLAYVHANPKTAGIVAKLDEWRYSDWRSSGCAAPGTGRRARPW
jgi:REP element-mobilizing transposase RayT